MSSNKDLFKKAWSSFPTGVSVITTIQDDGEVHGCTANAICSVSLEPLLVLICLDHKTNTIGFVQKRRRFGISILSEEQGPVAEYFARRPEDRKGDVEIEYSFAPSGLAAIKGAVFFMDCKVVTSHLAGDHTVFVGQVEDVKLNERKPLLYYERRFHRLPTSHTI